MQDKEDVIFQRNLILYSLMHILTFMMQLEKSLALACEQAEGTTQSLKYQISELKSHLSLEKNERSQEASNNQVILRYSNLINSFML